MNEFTFSNGLTIPAVGYGVFKIPSDETASCVTNAIKTGYRLIDTAQAYGNEEGVGEGIMRAGIDRSELFITTKVWISNYDHCRQSIEESLAKLNTPYIDLVLLHQPYANYYAAWKDLEECVDKGMIRSIGVSNFDADRLIDLCTFARIKPVLDQVETHVFQQQTEIHAYCQKYHVIHQAWAPIAKAGPDLLENNTLKEIAEAHHKTVCQTALRFLNQQSVAVIPKTVHQNRMKENLDLFDFALSEEEVSQIKGLNQNRPVYKNIGDPVRTEAILSSFQ